MGRAMAVALALLLLGSTATAFAAKGDTSGHRSSARFSELVRRAAGTGVGFGLWTGRYRKTRTMDRGPEREPIDIYGTHPLLYLRDSAILRGRRTGAD